MPQVTLKDAIQLAQQFQQSGNWQQAEEIFRQILAQKPNHAESWHQLGLLAFGRGDFDNSIDRFLRAISLDSSRDHYYANLGGAYYARGQTDAAIRAYRSALDLKPDRAESHNNLGNAFLESGDLSLAIHHLEIAVQTNPNRPEFHTNLGIAYEKFQRISESIAAHQRAIELKPDFAAAYTNLGTVFEKSDRLDEALAAHQRAIELQPNYADAHNNLSVTYRQLGRINDSITSARRAIALAPNHAEAHLNLAVALLVTGQFDEGWVEYEWRWKCKGFQTRPSPFPQPTWDGSDPHGKTILLHAEQGLGDTIQFIRFAPLLAARGARLTLGCPAPIKTLMQTVPEIEQVIVEGEKTPPFDLQASLLSLPRIIGTTPDTIPAKIPYLTADPQKISQWRTRLRADSPLSSLSSPFTVGLVWAGRPEHRFDHRRSIPLQTFAPIFQSFATSSSKKIAFFSLQFGDASKQLQIANFPITDLTADIHDFTDTAAAVCALDLVLTVDTSIAHLAGALGRPVWTLLPFAPDFRWLLDRTDSQWYPTMRLFRQQKFNDWAAVIKSVANELAVVVTRSQ